MMGISGYHVAARPVEDSTLSTITRSLVGWPTGQICPTGSSRSLLEDFRRVGRYINRQGFGSSTPPPATVRRPVQPLSIAVGTPARTSTGSAPSGAEPRRSARRPSRRGRVYTPCAVRRPSAAARCCSCGTDSCPGKSATPSRVTCGGYTAAAYPALLGRTKRLTLRTN